MKVGAYFDGRAIKLEDDAGYNVGGTAVSADSIASYDREGKIQWDDPSYRAAVWSGLGQSVPSVAAPYKNPAVAQQRKMMLFVLVLALVGVALLFYNCGAARTSSTTAKVDGTALASSAKAAVAPLLSGVGDSLGRDPIASVDADEEGVVIVTLSFTREFYLSGSGGGQVQLSDLSAGIASAIFDAVPEAQQVATFDANHKRLDSFNRKDRKTP